LLAWSGAGALAHEAPSRLPDPMTWAPRDLGELIKSPQDAINVFDFEPVAFKNVPPAHFGYMASGIDDEVTLRENREAFNRLVLRPRRLVDVTNIDPSVELFGVKWETPIIIAPTGGNRAFHEDGELAVARAAKARRHLQILSTAASTSVDDVTRERGAPIWFQLYASPSWDVAKALVKRAEAAGCPVVALTVDRVAGRNQETFTRLRRVDRRVCSDCHGPGAAGSTRTRPNYEGIDLSGLKGMLSSNLTWDFVRRLKDATRMKVVLKGILTGEDAKLSVDNGVDGIIVSNHGGRGEDSGGATIDALPEIVQAADGRIPILVDGGFRRGTDVVKALALGANGVCIGRPYLWGLGAFGQAGVERVLELMRAEFEVAMRQCGVRSVKELSPAFVRKA
jgi:isopentenyl diphosphate isomerase/L-lactate dehydrogenase-like FMN-dependent dehydrogenase